jgi:molybdopterin-containing oxidoreductase family membrane subunit
MLNFAIPFYVLFQRYRGHEVDQRAMFPWVVLTMFWAIALHTVTAFIFAADIARPFWHSALLAPRFLASAFCSGPAFLILVLSALRVAGRLEVPQSVIRMLAVIVTVALQVNLVMFASELFTELYASVEHHRSAVYLFLGLGEHAALVPWIWSAIAMQLVAVVALMIRPLRQRTGPLLAACALTAVGVWIEKGMGLVIPGFVPSPLGEIAEYTPSLIELQICAGVWALGMWIFVVLAKVSIMVERGELRAAA